MCLHNLQKLPHSCQHNLCKKSCRLTPSPPPPPHTHTHTPTWGASGSPPSLRKNSERDCIASRSAATCSTCNITHTNTRTYGYASRVTKFGQVLNLQLYSHTPYTKTHTHSHMYASCVTKCGHVLHLQLYTHTLKHTHAHIYTCMHHASRSAATCCNIIHMQKREPCESTGVCVTSAAWQLH
jgi:hypothetical protein